MSASSVSDPAVGIPWKARVSDLDPKRAERAARCAARAHDIGLLRDGQLDELIQLRDGD
jgi:hypothetical protein